MESFLSDTINVNIFNNLVKTLKPEKLFIQLCLHHYKELNSIFLLFDHNFYRNSSFLDVYLLIEKNFSLNDVENIYSYCQQLKITPYIYFYSSNYLYFAKFCSSKTSHKIGLKHIQSSLSTTTTSIKEFNYHTPLIS